MAGLRNQFSRYPKVSGTLSGTYQRDWTDEASVFVRADYIHTGSQWATEANLAKTGVTHRVNVRLGVQMDSGIRLELFGTNILNDKHFVGFQRFDDQIFTGFHLLTAGLPDKPVYGMRVSIGLDPLLKK
jgi:outer membrane receptor protein involved in Fe transport